MGTPLELVGQTFNRLTVIAEAGRDKHSNALWLCICSCGAEYKVRGGSLRSGKTQSCGCLLRERAIETHTMHGESKRGSESVEYIAWQGMKDRCTNENNLRWQDYGGRGISVCPEWLFSFEQFLADVGRRPEGRSTRGRTLYSLDRWPNNNGNYEPGNVRWATWKQQRENQRRTTPHTPVSMTEGTTQQTEA